MRTKEEIQAVLNKLDPTAPSKYFAMTFEQGVDEALMWALGDIDDSDFSMLED